MNQNLIRQCAEFMIQYDREVAGYDGVRLNYMGVTTPNESVVTDMIRAVHPLTLRDHVIFFAHSETVSRTSLQRMVGQARKALCPPEVIRRRERALP